MILVNFKKRMHRVPKLHQLIVGRQVVQVDFLRLPNLFNKLGQTDKLATLGRVHDEVLAILGVLDRGQKQ